MSSTTTNKKAVEDFLWEWSNNHGDWGKLLIHSVVTTESHLSSIKREEIFNFFLQSIGLYSGLPALSISKPVFIQTNKRIELENLSGISGVNRLAPNQTINFGKNLTVIFGENGVGKTGYSRILKAIGFSYDNNSNILPNIFGSPQSKSAIVKFRSDGESKTFYWNGSNKDPELNNISVFNSDCVKISLSDRHLLVSPIGFHLFDLVSSELNELSKLLTDKISSYPTNITWLSSLSENTPQYIFLSNLSEKSTEKKLNEISIFTVEHETELSAKEKEISELNKSLIQKDITELIGYKKELEIAIEKIQLAKTILTKEKWDALIVLNEQISNLEKQKQFGIKDIAEKYGVKFYDTKEFNDFINAAENYIKTINVQSYPTDEDVCVYCQQPLNYIAKDLLICYRNLFTDDTQKTLVKLQQQKNNLLNEISSIDMQIVFHRSIFGNDENQTAIQPRAIVEYNILLEDFKNIFIENDRTNKKTVFNFDYQKYINFLTVELNKFDTALDGKNKLLHNLSAKETELKKVIAELKDRKYLSTKKSEIKQLIENFKTVACLNSKTNSFNTSTISRKTTEARSELVKSDFNSIFKHELKDFRKTHINIDLSFGTERGKSKLSPKIKEYSLTDILSEGEQTAIALAEFLTELQLDNIKASVIFDDPVNSLDHHIIDDVARRLLKLSIERQVIIFTHSILLFNSLMHFCNQSNFENNTAHEFYNMRNEYDTIGIISEAEERNKVTTYEKKNQSTY